MIKSLSIILHNNNNTNFNNPLTRNPLYHTHPQYSNGQNTFQSAAFKPVLDNKAASAHNHVTYSNNGPPITNNPTINSSNNSSIIKKT
jgi:hypothetical protein